MSTLRTKKLPFAGWLYATSRLRFLRCEPEGDGLIAFLFSDERNEGPELEIEFESGAQVNAPVFYDSIKRLRSLMGAIERGQSANTRNEYGASRHR